MNPTRRRGSEYPPPPTEPIIPVLESCGIFHFGNATKLFRFWNRVGNTWNIPFFHATNYSVFGIVWNIPFWKRNEIFRFWNRMEYSILETQPIIPFLESHGIFHFGNGTKRRIGFWKLEKENNWLRGKMEYSVFGMEYSKNGIFRFATQRKVDIPHPV